MKAVRRKDTAPEMRVRRLLHGAGYRYRLHVTGLPGSPDIVFPSRRKVIFVHGCFWHGHDCRAGRPPQSRTDYWLPKIARNQQRDSLALSELSRMGWDSIIVWQCEAGGEPLLRRLQCYLIGCVSDVRRRYRDPEILSSRTVASENKLSF
jgi:DNA mismatch endonuclease (patch repair protein)